MSLKNVKQIDSEQEDFLKEFSVDFVSEPNNIKQAFINCFFRENIDLFGFSFTKKGTALLFNYSMFPWGCFPYPKGSAVLGFMLLDSDRINKIDILERMAGYQCCLFDHNKRFIRSLASQDHYSDDYHLRTEILLRSLFEAINFEILDERIFIDEEICFSGLSYDNFTDVFFGCGCKSGMGAFLSGDCGILSYGPQQYPFIDCSGFGIAGKAKNILINREEGLSLDKTRISTKYSVRLASESDVEYDSFKGLKDSGVKTKWMSCNSSILQKKRIVECCIEEIFQDVDIDYVFSFYIKGSLCFVDNLQKLRACSLDSYEGPATKIEIRGIKGSVIINIESKDVTLKIMPLSGANSFLGADFLIVVKPFISVFAFSLMANT